MAGSRPNILLILADHLNWNTICGRSPCKTPNINSIASGGITFGRSYTPVTVCCPTRAMLLTGAYPWHSGVFNQVHVPASVHPDLFEDAVTYSRLLSEAGYRTAYAGKWSASSLRGPSDFGYEEVPLPPGGDVEVIKSRYVSWPGSRPFLMWGTTRGDIEGCGGMRIARAAEGKIEDFSKSADPWLLEVHFGEPHCPYMPNEEFLADYKTENVELPPSYYEETFEDKPQLLRREAECWSRLTEDDFLEITRHYYAYSEQLDHFVGVVLNALADSNEAENTLVVISSDHGDMMGAHRLLAKGWMPYEETHRIPMVARLPGTIPAGSVSDDLVQLHDWAHTFVSLSGAEPLPYAHGRDLMPLLRDQNAGGQTMPEHILSCFYGAEFLYTQRIAIGKRYKYVFNGFAGDEFYDLQEDPGEIHNVIGRPDYQEAVRETRDALWELMLELDDPYIKHRHGAARYLHAHSKGKGREQSGDMVKRRAPYFRHWPGAG